MRGDYNAARGLVVLMVAIPMTLTHAPVWALIVSCSMLWLILDRGRS